MRYLTLFVVLAALLFSELLPSSVKAQSRAQEKVESLRSQLLEVEAKQAQLQTRLQQLDEELKPENIEKNLAGVGSTRPEDLREQRRRQLEIERNGVQSQLNLLTTSHTRLETAIAQAETEAYRQSAAPPIVVPDPNASPASTSAAGANDASATPVRPRRARKKKTRKAKRTSRPA
jgi:peptidoglycan hydrolase CwlO-like protein